MKLPGKPLSERFCDVRLIEGEPGRYHIKSRSGPHWHLVDLNENDFNGGCPCEDFKFRHGPEIRRNGVPEDQSAKCYHIRRAERYMLELSKRALYVHENQNAKPKPVAAPKPMPRQYVLDRNKISAWPGRKGV